ncbi:ABC transporter ATP-binding protein [Ferrovibrio sp. MS7]|uniref:ABC transporter ATP-binding protein n=1 Tax=Ferrovibrio plantarum TaxID=3119164 RepID=UPI003135E9A7
MQATAEVSEAMAGADAGRPLLVLEGVSKRFGSLQALADISLDFHAGEVHCLLGENGAGKSTLCNLIFGTHAPDTGFMRYQGREWLPSGPAEALTSGIAMVHQHFSVVPRMSVVENLMLGQVRGVLKHKDYAARIRELGKRYDLAVDPDAIVGELSVGERQRVEIVKCLMREPRLLVLDEPTAVLPPEEIGALLDIVRRVADDGRAVIMVTHKLAEIAKVADRVSVLRGGRKITTVRMAEAQMGDLVRAMVGREVVSLESALQASLAEIASPPTADDDKPKPFALICDGLTVKDRTGAVRLDNFTLEIRAGEVIGLAGVEGNGQSELGRVLAGLLKPSAGRFHIGDEDLTEAGPAAVTAAGGGIVPEDRHAVACVTGMSVAENIFLNKLGDFTRFGMLQRGAMTTAAKELMTQYDVRAASAEVAFGGLSGGNQQKAVLARELTLKKLVFLLAAQPTRGLDIGAVEAVYRNIRAAAARGVGVLLISSELDELIAASDRILVLYRGRVIGEKPARMDQREAIGALMSGHAA